jgi:hypothetical protein
MQAKQSERKQSPTRVLSRVTLVVAGIGLAFIIIEVSFRIAYVKLPYAIQSKITGVRRWGFGGPALGSLSNDFYQYCVGDEHYFARLLPDLNHVPLHSGGEVYHVTSRTIGSGEVGFRIPDTSDPWDGIVVGDSFTFCWGVEIENCWTQKIADQTGFTLANLGVAATGSVSHLRYLEDYGWALNPEVTIWQYWVDDHIDDYHHIISGLAGCPLPDSEATSSSDKPLRAFRDWLSHTFVTYDLVVAPLLRRLLPQYAGASVPQDFEQFSTNNGKRILAWTTLPSFKDPIVTEGMQLTKEAILEAARQAEKHGSVFVLLLTPDNLQTYIDFLPFDRLVAQAKLADQTVDELITFAERNNIQFIDLRPGLREAAAEGIELYPAYDVHWTAKGNQIVADILIQWLSKYSNLYLH